MITRSEIRWVSSGVRHRRAARRSTALFVVAVAVVGFGVSGCSSPAVADSRYEGVPPGVDIRDFRDDELTGVPDVLDPGDGSVEVITWGSSSCPPTAKEFTNSGSRIDVTFETLGDGPCTADLGPTTHVFSASTVGQPIPDAASIMFVGSTTYIVDVQKR